jgi:hypothetical protein
MEVHVWSRTEPFTALLSEPRGSLLTALEQLDYQRGAERLMLAVLKDAVECIERYHNRHGVRSRPEYEAALHWVHSRDRAWPFSFENICLRLDLDSDRLRSALAASFSFRGSHGDTFHPKASAALRSALESPPQR